MSEIRRAFHSRSQLGGDHVWRLDQLPNPLGPPERVIDDVARFDGWTRHGEDPTRELRDRLGARGGVPASWVVLANGIDELHSMIAQWRNGHGPMVLFPPSDPHLHAWLQRHNHQVEFVQRGKGFSIPVNEGAQRLPHGSTSVVMTPNDPTGTIMTVQEAVTLSRRSSIVVIDERHAAYSPRTLAPLVREFENMVLLQTFETFASLTAFPLAWAIAPPAIAASIREFARPSGIARVSAVAALAALDAEAEIRASVRHIMIEKGRLYRQIRKLSMISPPYPSWANFLLGRFERGTTDFFLPRLIERGVVVQPVDDPRLPNHIRMSAVSIDATYALKHALVESALDLP
jgi:histidinol-phosphate aminotransferase